MKRIFWSTLLSLTALLSFLVTPAYAVQNGTVVASAVVVPAQITRLSFLSSGLVKELTVKEGDKVSVGQTVAVLNTPDLEYNVTAAQEAFRSADINAQLQRFKRVKDIRNGRTFWDVVPPEVRQKADAQAASALAAVDVAKAILAQSTLISPTDATVASVDVFPGEFVNSNQTVITLATLDTLQLETTDLSERDVTKVKVGATVSIVIEALNQTVTGKIMRIAPMADTVGGDVVFKVIIVFDEQPTGLLWGMTTEVTIE